jgi:hypothetical protein
MQSIYSKICDILYWIVHKYLLTGTLTKSFKLNKEQLNVLCWANATEPCSVNSGEKDQKVHHRKQDRISSGKLHGWVCP